MLEGSRMMPEPIILTVTSVVRATRPIFLFDSAMAASLWSGVVLDGEQHSGPQVVTVRA